MAKEIRNVGASVPPRLLQLAKASGQSFGLVLTRFALERLLFRLSQSPHAGRIVLKGAMLMMSWFDDPHRGTRDLDLLGFGDRPHPQGGRNEMEAAGRNFVASRGMAAEPTGEESYGWPLREDDRGEAALRSDMPHRARGLSAANDWLRDVAMAAAYSWAMAPIPAYRRTNHSGFKAGRTRSRDPLHEGSDVLARSTPEDDP